MTRKQGVEETLRKGTLTIPKNNETLTELGFDYVEKHFSTEEEFFKMLKEKEEATTRAIVAAENCIFLEIDAKMKTRLIKAGYPEDLVDNTIANTCLVCKIEGKLYLINSSAMSAIKTKAFSRFDNISPKMKAAFLNATISEAATMSKVQDDVMPMVFGGKLSALMSGVYTPIIPVDFFKTGLTKIKEKIGEYKIIEAVCSNVTYRMKIVFTGKKAKELQSLYKKKLNDFAKRRGTKVSDNIKETELCFGVISGTDEAGQGTAYMRPYVNVGKLYGFEVGTPITVYHRGKNDIMANLGDNIENMFSIFNDVVEKLSAAILTDIKNWRSVMDGVCQELRIPDDVATKLIVQFAKDYPGTGTVTSYDIMMAILMSSEVYQQVMQPSDSAFGAYEARIASILNMDLAKFDYDPLALETELKSQVINDYSVVLERACDVLKMPKTIANTVISGFDAKVGMERMMNMGNEPTITSWDIYQALIGASKIYRDYLASRCVADAEAKALAFEKNIRRARKLCFVKYDVA